MSRDDLLSDLRQEVAARPAAPSSPPPGPVPSGTGRRTPAFDVSVTPLRWALPSLGPARGGTGLALRFGPVQVSAALR